MQQQFSNQGGLSLSRRSFMNVGSAGLLGLSLDHLLRQRALFAGERLAPRAKNVIMLFLTGGPSTIDMWDMKPEARENIRGEFRPRDTSVPGIQICEPMPELALRMHHATLVRSVAHSVPEHTQGATHVMTGNRPTPAFDYPSLGSLSARLVKSENGVPAYMSVGSPPAAGAGELGSALSPFEFSLVGRNKENQAKGGIGLPDGFTAIDLDRRQGVLERIDQRMRKFDSSPLAQQLDRFQREALEILRSDKINTALNLDNEAADKRKSYGEGILGRNVLAARRLIEAGARFVTIGFNDWDTHVNNFSRLRTTLLPQLDKALSALLEDLHLRGLLDETIVYCTGEFGRTPAINPSAGRDHWSRAMTALIAGGGFRRGITYGATDKDGSDPIENSCSPDDLSATIFHQLGFLPTQTVQTQSDRPIALFRNGKVIEGLVG